MRWPTRLFMRKTLIYVILAIGILLKLIVEVWGGEAQSETQHVIINVDKRVLKQQTQGLGKQLSPTQSFLLTARYPYVVCLL